MKFNIIILIDLEKKFKSNLHFLKKYSKIKQNKTYLNHGLI